MKIDWEIIKEKIEGLIKGELENSTPSYNNVTDGLELFWKTIIYKSNIHDLDGLPKILIPALQEALIEKSGDGAPVLQVATSLEPYLRKLLVLTKNIQFNTIKSLNLVGLMKRLELNTDLTNQSNGGYPQLEKENLKSFKGKDEYLEFLCHARLIRNEVHNSPVWNALDVITNLKSILIVYIYATLKYEEEIKKLPKKEILYSEVGKKFDTEENKMLFDFISFGNTTTEIKTQVINAYILHFLINNNESTVGVIKSETNSYFGKDLSIKFYDRRLQALIQKKQIEFADDTKTKYVLTGSERKRLTEITNNFSDNKELFLLYLDDIVNKYKLEDASEDLLDKLQVFFEANFNIDVQEAYDRGIEITKNENAIYCDFVTYLKGITKDESTAAELFRELLLLSNDSDFLLRLSASKVFSRLTNPDQFQNYLRQQERVVFLDTQLILHALCLNYTKNIKYDNIYYKITDELFEFTKQNPNIKLKISKLYLSEVAHQLKLALLLVPFEEYYSDNFSNNIFYLFYKHLKSNELLEQEHNSFEEFLDEWLLVREDDVYSEDFEDIARENLQDLLKRELGIDIVYLPKYQTKDSSINVLEEVIKTNLYNPKPHHALVNDALMVCHLSDSDSHESEPFFLTWDKSFTEFRKEYKKKFKKMDLISWHLFNPSKFLNHMSLLDLNIDSGSLTNEYLSIIDSLGIHEKTQTIVDGINKFLDLKSISKSQRRKYIRIAESIFNENEFNYSVSVPEEKIKESITSSFSHVIERINSYYHRDDSKFNITQYRKVMLDEDSFIKISNIVAEQVKVSISDGNIKNDFLKEIDAIIEGHTKK